VSFLVVMCVKGPPVMSLVGVLDVVVVVVVVVVTTGKL